MTDQPKPKEKLQTLTPEQRSQMPIFAEKWMAFGRSTTPLTEQEWADWKQGARECYGYADAKWPGDSRVHIARNPLVGAVASPKAAMAIDAFRSTKPNEYKNIAKSAIAKKIVFSSGGAEEDHEASKYFTETDQWNNDIFNSNSSRPRELDPRKVSQSDLDIHGVMGLYDKDAINAEVDSIVVKILRDVISAEIKDQSQVPALVQHAMDKVQGKKLFWHYWLGGRLWGWWPAFVAFFRDVVKLEIPAEVWERSVSYQKAMSAGYWWPNLDFVIVCDTPTSLHVETVNNEHRLHNANGPSISWPGFKLFHWHGTKCPPSLILTDWSPEQIMKEENQEIRRCAIERIGWDVFIEQANLKLVDESEDVANPGQTIGLYDIPLDVINFPVRVLLVANATIERDGKRRRFGLTVPTDCKTALEAVAWSFGVTVDEYKTLQRAT